MNRRILLIAAAALVLLVFVIATQFYQRDDHDQTAQLVEQNLKNLVRAHSPALGNADAKVHIVEFLDPACETCPGFHSRVKQLMVAIPDRIRLSLRYAPFHSGSDYVVKLLEGARKQSKYWETLETLLTSQSWWMVYNTAHAELVWLEVQDLGMDLEQLRRDMKAPEIERLITQDLADARALNVTDTPEFFVDGRPLPSLGDEQLERLVHESLTATYRYGNDRGAAR